MSLARDFVASSTPPEEIIFPPGDLWSDEPPMESDGHRKQMNILIRALETWFEEREDFYVSGNLTIYYSPNPLKSEDFRGPDFFFVWGVERKERRSWVVWQEEGKYPNVIIEILSDSTAATDKGLKKQIYQDTFRTPEYFWFDPKTLQLKGFELVRGRYEELDANERGWLWSQELELYLGVYEARLRFFSAEGQLVPIPEEMLEAERQRAESEREQKELAQQQMAEMETLLVQYRQQFGELSQE